MRMLLHKQDKVTQLEQELNKIDLDEKRPLFLGCRRKDTNKEREKVFMDLDIALGVYGTEDIIVCVRSMLIVTFFP